MSIFVDPKLKDNAYYDPSKNTIVLGKAFARDTDILFREFTHHALDVLAQQSLGREVFAQFADIESGLADYFPCSFSNDPAMGEASVPVFRTLYGAATFPNPYIRMLKNTRTFSELKPSAAPQDSGEVWGGAFWDIRELLGQEKADAVFFSTWRRLRPEDARGDPRHNWVARVSEAMTSLGMESRVADVRAVFARRGVKA